MASTLSKPRARTFVVLVAFGLISSMTVGSAGGSPPTFTLTKTATPAVIHAGDVVTYEFTAENNGIWPLSVVVTDNLLGEVGSAIIYHANSEIFTVSIPVFADETNFAEAVGEILGSDIIVPPVTATAQASVDVITPAIAVSKTPSVTEAAPGDIVEYAIEITNTGDTALVAGVDDSVFGTIAAGVELGVGESATYTAEHHVYGTISNTATVVGVDAIGGVVQAEATATVTVTGDDTTPPQFTSGPSVTEITEDSVTVVWTTNEAADGRVRFDTRAGFLENEVADTDLVTSHTAVLDGLTPATTYHFVVSSTDAARNTATSKDLAFATNAPPDGTAPTVTLVTPPLWTAATQVMLESADQVEIDRVEFLIDGTFVYADYSPPFGFFVDTTRIADGAHLVTSRAFDDVGNPSVDTAPIDVVNVRDTTVPTVVITWPGRDDEVSGNIKVKIDLTDDVGLFKGTLRVDGQWFGDWYPDPGKAATSLSIEYPWDTRLVENGRHRVAFEIYDTDLKYDVGFVDVYVKNTPPPPPPKLVITRSVVRHQNYFTIDLTVKNVGGDKALDVTLEDYLQMFQPISRSTASVDYVSSYKPDLTSWRIRISDSIGIAAGAQRTYRYDAVPVLVYPGSPTPMIGGDKYSPSLGTTDAWYEDAGGQNYFDKNHLLYSPSQAGSTYSDALATADYLLVTSPDNLFRLNPDADTNELLSSMAQLAKLENGVLGFLDVPASFPRQYDLHDAIAVGDLVDDAKAEVVIGDLSADRVSLARIPTTQLKVNNAISYEVKWYQDTPFKVGDDNEGMDAGDRLAVGNVFGGPKEQVVLADASADVFIAYDGGGKRQGSFIISDSGTIHDIEPFDGLTAGNVVPGGRDELVFADRSEDKVYVLQFVTAYPNDPFSTVHKLNVLAEFSTSYEAHDGIATGDVTGDATDEIVLADRSGNRVYIFSYTGTFLGSFTRTFDEGDSLAVANSVSTYPDKAEIMIGDASADRVDAYAADGTLLSSVKRDLETFDGLAAGPVAGGTVGDVVVADRSLDYLDFHNLYRQSADKYVLRDLLKGEPPSLFSFLSGSLGPTATGAWSTRLREDFVAHGYLLIVGESDIVPTWGDKHFGSVLTTHGKRALVADATDYPYASTYGEEIVPELAMGRIIGNTASELRKPIEASIGVVMGISAASFDRSHAFTVSGYPAGLYGGADKINFASEALDVSLILKNSGTDPIYMDTSLNTKYKPDGSIDEGATRAAVVSKFFTNVVGKDVIFLSGHGNSSSWDLIRWSDVLTKVDPFGVIAPFIFASSCQTGDFSNAFSVANSFLSRGAAVYLGATKWGLGTHVAISKLLYGKWDPGESIGDVVREVKRSIGFDTYGSPFSSGGTYPDLKEQYWTALYHLFGDPKFGTQGPPGPAAASVLGSAGAPPETVTVEVPPYEVESTVDGHRVVIPGGGLLAVDGMPLVPYYTTTVDIPPGYQVQDVVMTERSEPTSATGLVIPVLLEAVGGTDTPTAAANQPASDAEWWPHVPFGWDVISGPVGDVLAITVYPVDYRSATTDLEFFDEYSFDVATAPSSTEVRALELSDPVFGLDRATGEIRFGDGEHGEVPPEGHDVVVAVYVRDGGTGELVAGLPLRMLRAVRGAGEFSIEWDPTDVAPGDYDVEVELRTTDGIVLDSRETTVRVGEQPTPPNACGEMTPTIVGTEGDDELWGTPGDDIIAGLGGNDIIHGLGGNDIICGGPGDDIIDGGPGDDVLDGGPGDDVVDPGFGSDRMRGGAGEDLARLDGDPAGVSADLSLGVATSTGGIDATLSGFENMTGGPGPDDLTGDAGPNTINGASGDDVLYGHDGDDKLIGASGNETIYGDGGDDRVLAGNGGDVVYGGPGDDDLDGGPGNDTLVGGPGEDHANGAGGTDTCEAEATRRC